MRNFAFVRSFFKSFFSIFPFRLWRHCKSFWGMGDTICGANSIFGAIWQISSLYKKNDFRTLVPSVTYRWLNINKEIVTNWSGKFLYIFKVDIIVLSRLLALNFVTKEVTCIFWVILFIASTFLKGNLRYVATKGKIHLCRD